jgi:hypothetical protein
VLPLVELIIKPNNKKMKAEKYNLYSDSMVRKLKQDERATYRVTNIREDPDNYGRYLVPAALQIPSTDVIFDKDKNDFITIAAIERQDNEGNPVFINIVFSSSNIGHLFLVGSNPVHQKIYQYLEICNYNDSNPNRNQDAEVFFRRLDAQKEAKQERLNRRLIVRASNMALELDDKRVKEVALALGIDAESLEEIRNYVEDYAENDPEEFIQVVERSSLEKESILKEAVKQGIIRNNVNSQVFEWVDTAKEIMKYKKAPNKNYFKELADYLEETNPDELNAIKSRLG